MYYTYILRYSVCDTAFTSFIVSRKGFVLLCLSGCEFIITTISLQCVKHAQIISSLYNEKKQVMICLVVDHSQIKCVYMVCIFRIFRICSEFSAMFRICSESFRILSNFQNFQTLFRISSTKTGLFRISWLCSVWHLILKKKAVFLDI
jgi:hypothetical protein